MPDEPLAVALLDGGHEVAADVAVDDVQPVDREEQDEQQRGRRGGPAADLGGHEHTHRAAQACERLSARLQLCLRCYHRPPDGMAFIPECATGSPV